MPSLLTRATELRQRRARLAEENRTLINAAGDANRELTTEERTQFDTRFTQIEELRGEVERLERQHALDAELESTPAPSTGRPSTENRGGDNPGENRGGGAPELPAEVRTLIDRVSNREHRARLEQFAAAEYRTAYAGYLAGGMGGVSPEQRAALNAGVGAEGGFLIAPLQMQAGIIQAVDDLVFIRQWATTETVVNAEGLGMLSLDADPDDFEWTSELRTGSQDDEMRFGRRELHPHPLAKRVKVSNKLLRQSTQGVEGIVMRRVAYKAGTTQEKHFLLGSGAKQPLGVYTASDAGIPTSRDVSAGNTATEVTFDGLIAVKYSLKSPYLNNSRWLFHRDGVRRISQLKDGNGQYLWRESVRVGEPDTILGRPVFMSEFNPSTFTTGRYVGILGDFRYYHIVDALTMQIQRLVELYAETNQTGYIFRQEVDAMPTMGEAFSRVKLG